MTENTLPIKKRIILLILKLLYYPYKKTPILFHSFRWARTQLYKFQHKVLVSRPVQDSGPFLEEIIKKAEPSAVGKMGDTEVRGLATYIKRKAAANNGKSLPSYSSYILRALHVNSGVFPQNEESFDVWAEQYFSAVLSCDALSAWYVAQEAGILRKYCQEITLLDLVSMEPYFSDIPWTRTLAGKRVLVISPFTETIKKQYEKRQLIWPDKNVLPDFELFTIKAPLSAGLVQPTSKDWPEALEKLKKEMDAHSYDVALIGAGAFSLPLAVHAKQSGKIGIHLGGALQILFGVSGHRWKNRSEFKTMFNEHWTGPSAEETPRDVEKKRNGSPDYW